MPPSPPSADLASGNAGATRRRPHQKSRLGCADCRRRRVKCDEAKPSCGSCMRRDISCEYPSNAPAPAASRDVPRTPDSSTSLSLHASSPARHASAQAVPPSTLAAPASQTTATASPDTWRASPVISADVFNMSDLALFHHWTLSTSISICRAPEHHELWQRGFPQIGFEHPFVVHALLSIAALHLAYIDGSRDGVHIVRAAEHHNIALRGFRQSAAEITEKNSEALFVWSLLNMVYVFGVSTHHDPAGPPDGSSGSYKDAVLGVEWIPMIRGIEAVLHPTYDYLRFGRMKPLMSLGNWEEIVPGQARAQGVDGRLCHAQETWKQSSDAETYDEVLWVLRKCFVFTEQFQTMDAGSLAKWGYNRSWSGPLMFIHFAPQAYFTLLHQRQPAALVLFAFFGGLLHRINDFWFMEGRGKEIVQVVDDLLGSYWRPWISWPLEGVGLG